MAQTPPQPVTIHLVAHTVLASIFIRLVSIPVLYGWKPGPRVQAALAGIAGRLIWVTASRPEA